MSASWAGTACGQAGVISRAQLAADGLGRSAVDRLIHSGALEQQLTGVYLVRGAPRTYEAQLWTAALATGGVLSHGTAAHLWGVIDTAPHLVHVTISPDRRLKTQDGVLLHRLFVPAKCATTRHGLPVSARTWTILDHLASLPFPEACTLADRAFQQGWLTADDLQWRLRDHSHRFGNATLRRLGAVTGDGAAAVSERLLHRILRDAGITGWVPNLDIWSGGDLIGVADVAFPDHGLIVEVDGWAHHSAPDRFQRDRSRQNDLVLAGWTVLRFTWRDLTERPGYVATMIKAQLDRVA